MLFDDSPEAMNKFVGAVMFDFEVLINRLGSLSSARLTDNTYVSNYRFLVAEFSEKLTRNTDFLKRDISSNPSDMILFLRHIIENQRLQMSNNAANSKLSTTTVDVQTLITIPIHPEAPGEIKLSPPIRQPEILAPLSPSKSEISVGNSNEVVIDDQDKPKTVARKYVRVGRKQGRLCGPKRMLRFEQTAILRAIYAKQPFLSPEERIEVADQLGITAQQVKIWFQNRRFKDKMPVRKRTGSV